jgi:hypothetical protein
MLGANYVPTIILLEVTPHHDSFSDCIADSSFTRRWAKMNWRSILAADQRDQEKRGDKQLSHTDSLPS